VLGAWLLGTGASGFQCTINGNVVQQDEPCPVPAVETATTGNAAPPPAPVAAEDTGPKSSTAFYDPEAAPAHYKKPVEADLQRASPQSMFARLDRACAQRDQNQFYSSFTTRFRKLYSQKTDAERKKRFDDFCTEFSTPLLQSYVAGPGFSIASGTELCSLPTPTTPCTSGWHVAMEDDVLKLDQQ
jgi:hypothetical protein